ncbi:hypothetical protein [Saccharibacillus sp. O23]|uniref:hypothetical protein n=1 Tax=Saccharibacillus sp. O23 TaxID=2009338 RepID=UPI00117A9D35|nr:hypothetical protein [Saccharibacillus sp. O23]
MSTTKAFLSDPYSKRLSDYLNKSTDKSSIVKGKSASIKSSKYAQVEKGASNSFESKFDQAIQHSKDWFSNLYESSSDKVEQASNGIQTYFGGVVDSSQKKWKELENGFKEKYDDLSGQLDQSIQSGGVAIHDAYESAKDAIEQSITNVKTWSSDFYDKTEKNLVKAKDQASVWVSGVYEDGKRLAKSTFSSIKTGLSKGYNWTMTTGMDKVDGVFKKSSEITESIKSVTEPIFDFRDHADKISEFAEKFMQSYSHAGASPNYFKSTMDFLGGKIKHGFALAKGKLNSTPWGNKAMGFMDLVVSDAKTFASTINWTTVKKWFGRTVKWLDYASKFEELASSKDSREFAENTVAMVMDEVASKGTMAAVTAGTAAIPGGAVVAPVAGFGASMGVDSFMEKHDISKRFTGWLFNKILGPKPPDPKEKEEKNKLRSFITQQATSALSPMPPYKNAPMQVNFAAGSIQVSDSKRELSEESAKKITKQITSQFKRAAGGSGKPARAEAY